MESAGFEASRPLLVGAVIAFLVLGLLFVVLLVRALQGQVRTMLSAAHRIGGGDFSQRLPVQGNDELAGLAREFNAMSERLGAQMDELRDQRLELDLAGKADRRGVRRGRPPIAARGRRGGRHVHLRRRGGARDGDGRRGERGRGG